MRNRWIDGCKLLPYYQTHLFAVNKPTKDYKDYKEKEKFLSYICTIEIIYVYHTETLKLCFSSYSYIGLTITLTLNSDHNNQLYSQDFLFLQYSKGNIFRLILFLFVRLTWWNSRTTKGTWFWRKQIQAKNSW